MERERERGGGFPSDIERTPEENERTLKRILPESLRITTAIIGWAADRHMQ